MIFNLGATHLKNSYLSSHRAVVRRDWETITSLCVAALTSACGNSQSGAPPHTAETPRSEPAPDEYEVRWHPTLLEFIGPSAPADKQQSTLAARLGQEWQDGLQLTNGQRRVEVRSCRALIGLDGTYETLVPSEPNIYQDREAQCRAAALLVRSQPAKTSFLHGFALDSQAPNRLPAALAFTTSPEDDERVAQATARGEPWSAVEEVRLLEQVSASEARFGAGASEQSLTIVGHGDVNGDGFEDLLLLSRGRLTEGSLRARGCCCSPRRAPRSRRCVFCPWTWAKDGRTSSERMDIARAHVGAA